ncbi:MAG: hypothetical protein EPO28_05055 [Saprospiraceae bacterium]|nr:MAG: hypothetical protein EPO28_05055 [Saprospiraceae bacterium]
MDERQMMNKLRELLLAEDRQELERLRRLLGDPALWSEKVTPLIDERLEFLKNNFPVEFRISVENIIEQKLEASRDELLDIIYPTLGQMIKKYIQHQIQLLKENLEEQLRNTFQRGFAGRLRYALSGVKPKEMSDSILSKIDGPVIEEIFVIEQHSGILLGSASRHDTIDLDMIAGMLTAIKSFVEDAFQRGDEKLEGVQYGTFSILIENFYTYYIAVAVSGSFSTNERMALSDSLAQFAQNDLKMNLKKRDGTSNYLIRQKLEHRFFNPQMATLHGEQNKNPTQ